MDYSNNSLSKDHFFLHLLMCIPYSKYFKILEGVGTILWTGFILPMILDRSKQRYYCQRIKLERTIHRGAYTSSFTFLSILTLLEFDVELVHLTQLNNHILYFSSPSRVVVSKNKDTIFVITSLCGYQIVEGVASVCEFLDPYILWGFKENTHILVYPTKEEGPTIKRRWTSFSS